MAFSQISGQNSAVSLLRRSLAAGRLAHGILLEGEDRQSLEDMAAALAKTLNCLQPLKDAEGPDACGLCASCRRIDEGQHTDVLWVRPESKTRVITIDQMRDAMRSIQMKPVEGKTRCTILVGADRLNSQAANAFLKTLEEPPPSSIIVLLTGESRQLLSTIRSRCVRIRLSSPESTALAGEDATWLGSFAEMAASDRGGLMGRYRLLGSLLGRLGSIRQSLEKQLGQASPLERYDDVDARTRDQWEAELKASVESEYRLFRGQILLHLEWWLRDVWLVSRGESGVGLRYAEWADYTHSVGTRLREEAAVENLFVLEALQRQLGSNVQEALALEVSFLKLKL